VGCNNEKLSQDYANQLYTRKYLRDTSVTGRLGDMHINKVSNASECPTILIRTLESGVNALPRGRTNFPCSSSVAIILVSGCEPSNSRDSDFNTVEVITQDNQNQSVDLERECLDFMNRQG
jgi:hypothetical protein